MTSEAMPQDSTQPATTPSAKTLPGSSRLILVSDKAFPRYAEADVIALKNGRLFLALGRKEGSEDTARGTLIGLYSLDNGLSWSDEPVMILAPWEGKTDLYSTSLLRTPRGLHLFFMCRGQDPKRDTKVYQMVSGDETRTWSKPERVSPRDGYHVLNNARVIRTSKGRIIIPTAYLDGAINKEFKKQRIYCTYSDDDGKTWQQSNDLIVENKPLMEPGVAECADGSLYMIIRTSMGTIWEARSRDGGATWGDLRSTDLPAPAAPATLVRAPDSNDLWLFFCNNAKGNWKGRTNILFAASQDNGKTWSVPRPIEDDAKHGYGYLSFLVTNDHALLTYYDWPNNGQPNFQGTNLRQRLIPLGWFRNKPTPPVFRKTPEPVLKQEGDEGETLSVNSGVVADRLPWQIFYTAGNLGPKGETLAVRCAESRDRGATWTRPKSNLIFPRDKDDHANYYHASAHREGEQIVAFIWRNAGPDDSCLYRYVSSDARNYVREPEHPLMVSRGTNAKLLEAAEDEGHVSNDAFDVMQNPDGTWSYYAAVLEKAEDKRSIVKHDNAAGLLRMIGRATSADGARFAPIDIILRPDFETRDEWTVQFYGMQVFTYRKFWLALLHTFYVQSQIIQPEWCWSHDGVSWARMRTPAIPLGDERTFDSRMIVFGSIIMEGDEIIWIYSGMDWRHNAFKKGQIHSAIGRATLPRKELDAWLDSLPQP